METSAANERENYWRELVAGQQKIIVELTRSLAEAGNTKVSAVHSTVAVNGTAKNKTRRSSP